MSRRAERRACLRAAHSTGCPNRNLSALESAGLGAGCRCKPRYFTFHRGADGRPVKGPRVLNRQAAERALRKLQTELDEGTLRPRSTMTFSEWADEWTRGLRAANAKENTLRTYKTTLEYAKRTFGDVRVSDVTQSDVRRMLDVVQADNASRQHSLSPATLASHLRQLKACFGAAISEGHAHANPTNLHKTFRPKVDESEAVYFASEELPRLWTALANKPVYLFMAKLAVATGARQGELRALRWTDIGFLEREMRLRRGYSKADGETTTKGRRSRTVDLTPQALTVLEQWHTFNQADPGSEQLVFQAPSGGYVDDSRIRQNLYTAMTKAGIPRAGEHGRKRDFHSFRHTFARIALENAAEITWVQRQLGHSSITLTVDLYGRWERKAEKLQAERLAGAFPL
jgi:integrase